MGHGVLLSKGSYFKGGTYFQDYTVFCVWGLFRPQLSVGPPYDKTVTYVTTNVWYITKLIKVSVSRQVMQSYF